MTNAKLLRTPVARYFKLRSSQTPSSEKGMEPTPNADNGM